MSNTDRSGDRHADGGAHVGRCRVCGQQFVYADQGEYKSAVARHIVDNHRDQPIDKPIVEKLSEDHDS